MTVRTGYFRTSMPAPLLLLVDDDDAIRQTALQLLNDHGYDVITVADGGAALSALSGGLEPLVIILDLLMPISGWEVWDWLQTRRDLVHVPVIVWTATGLSQGAVGHARVVHKGKADDLLAAIADVLPRA